ncbi:MAG TPA: SCO family protein [Acidobacteriaceae bacterium]|nr:SCO family protein [Acidobacteriaceae bacterium]
MERAKKLAVGAVLVCAVWAGGCRRTVDGGSADGSHGVAAVKTFAIHGRIVSVDAAKGSVVLNAAAVPGFMEAMTMSYKLKDSSIVGELHSGDMISAKLLVRKVGDEFEDAMLDEIVVVAQARPDYKPAVAYHVPAVGDAVPDFKLLNENGRTIHLGQFKGRVLLLTFIYTRCPLEDYCPRMNKNFAEIEKQLAGSAAYGKTHLLSVSFDPKFDTPAVLKGYAAEYTGGDARKFAHWDFAAPPESGLMAMEEFFDVGVTPGDAGSLNHSLSTAVIGKDGRIVAWYPTNEWTVADVIAKMKAAAAA